MGLKKKRKKSRDGSTERQAEATKDKIEELRRLERHAFRPRHGKTDFHEYLKGIYNAWDWTDAKTSAQVGRRVAALCKVQTRAGNSPIRVVIDATSKEGRQTKSRWTRALEYAVAKGARGTAFKKFLKNNGGAFGCAQEMAKLQNKLRKKKSKPKRRKRSNLWA